MKFKKVKKLKFDFSNLKFAILVLLAAFLYDYFTSLIDYNDFRGSNLRKNGICLAVGVVSASANIPQRNAIRAGWGGSKNICHLKFFIATNKDWSVVQKVPLISLA
jgi:hypothetical protein